MAVKEDLWAQVQLYDLDKMDVTNRKKIVAWLREQARTLLKDHAKLDRKYRARYWK